MAKRPEYPKDAVKRAFADGGADAARKAADKIAAAGQMPGAARAPSQVDRWLREWGAATATSTPEKPATDARKAAKIEKEADRGSRRRLSNKEIDRIVSGAGRRVYDISEPNVHGTVVTEGEQVSAVKWDVPSPWGKESFVGNDKLIAIEEAVVKADKIFAKAKCFRVLKPNGKTAKVGKNTVRMDDITGEYLSLDKAIKAIGDDNSLWLFAVTKGGSTVVLPRPHWSRYLKLKDDAA